MTAAEWQVSSDLPAMIRWAEKQGYGETLWDFAVATCRRIRDDLPGDAFRRVVTHAGQIGMHGIDDVLVEAWQALEQLERRLRRADATAQDGMNRQIGLGRIVFAFESQDGASAARDISTDFLAWSDDMDAERRMQADLLRQLVPDPSLRAAKDNDGT
jgi:hypothetical protein